MSHAVNRVVPNPSGGFQLQDKNGRLHGQYATAREADQISQFQSVLAGKPWEHLAPENPPFRPEINYGATKLKSNMPKGASLSPKGDLGALRQREAKVVGKNFKGPRNIVRAKDAF